MTEPTAEQLHRANFRGVSTLVTSPSDTTGGFFAGRTTIPSGTATVTVSTTLIQSDGNVDYGVQISSADPALVNSGGFVAVNSIVQGTSFAFAWATGVAVPQDVIVMWELRRR